ncbi:MAG: hypothetical protein WCG80_02470 [Spirochaetales bacterium]
MKLFRGAFVAVAALVALSLSACASMPVAMADPFAKLSEQAQTLTERGVVVGQGIGIDNASRQDIARQKAIIDATAQVAQTFNVKVEGLTKSFTESLSGSTSDGQETNDAFSRALKTAVKQSLSGIRQFGLVMYTKEANKVTASVLMGIDPKAANQSMIDEVKKTDPKLYERFRASKAYDELSSEMDKYDATK